MQDQKKETAADVWDTVEMFIGCWEALGKLD